MYTDDDLLTLSGIQHIAFCERQYALIYVEDTWNENALTAEGRLVHTRVDNPELSEKRAHIENLKALPVVSYQLGLQGVCDVVEKKANELYPVEYKRGRPKQNPCDEVQLCAQAICLEEMYKIFIPQAFIYYAQIRHRHAVVLTEQLRTFTRQCAQRMHEIFKSTVTPKAIYKSHCKSCSMIDHCMPRIFSKKISAYQYNIRNLRLLE
ncbi:MAG TPA: CRISPR-associated protein Cas4 [Salinivirgaceae bacterium]|nr:CRISPR-associated protein Cas4 [Salinivirgaceae bacterium]